MVEPGVLVAEQRPGPSWFDGLEQPQAQGLSAGELGAALAIELGKARDLRAQVLSGDQEPPQITDGLLSGPDDPQATFHELAQKTSKVLGISLADAYSRVSQEAPTLYERATAKARLN